MNWAEFIELKQDHLLTSGEVFFKVKVRPGSPKNEVYGLMADEETLEVRVRGEAQDGKANRDLLDLLAQLFRVFPEQVIIKSGFSSRHKLIQILGDE